jgi:putative ABC transport system substrate-binding protein
MKRRDFVRLAGGVALWPLAAQAQQAMPTIGFLHSGSAEQNVKRLAGFGQGLADVGFNRTSPSNGAGPTARPTSCPRSLPI